ncbi:hypothetical protein D3C72_1471110 [compost metagenome]
MRVIPEEGQAGTGQRAAEDHQLAGARNVRDEQVARIRGVTRQIGEQAQSRAHHHGWHDGQTIEAVGEIDGVAGADDDAIGQRDEAPHAQRIADGLEERHDQVGLRRQVHGEARLHPGVDQIPHVARVGFRHGDGKRQVKRGDDADQRLPEVFFARAHAFRILVHHLAVVVGPADGAKAQGDDQDRPDEAVRQVGPQQGGNADGDEDQHTAHGGRAVFFQMRLRAVRTHSLADLHAREHADHGGTGAQADQDRRQGGEDGAERDEVKDPQWANVVLEIMSEPEQHD